MKAPDPNKLLVNTPRERWRAWRRLCRIARRAHPDPRDWPAIDRALALTRPRLPTGQYGTPLSPLEICDLAGVSAKDKLWVLLAVIRAPHYSLTGEMAWIIRLHRYRGLTIPQARERLKAIGLF